MKNPDHARFAEWDAAYVLGALSPAERREFEDHLEECERCRTAVTELSALPGLLGRIDDARAFALLEETDEEAGGAPATTPGTVDTVIRIRAFERRRKVRRTLITVVGLASAAVLASVLTLVIPALVQKPASPDAVVPLSSSAEGGVPIDVLVTMTSVKWGTKLQMDCNYHTSTDANSAWGPTAYSLWVVGDDGSEAPVSTWKSAPGSDVRVEAGTATSLDDIAQLQLRTADGAQTIMTGSVDRP